MNTICQKIQIKGATEPDLTLSSWQWVFFKKKKRVMSNLKVVWMKHQVKNEGPNELKVASDMRHVILFGASLALNLTFHKHKKAVFWEIVINYT